MNQSETQTSRRTSAIVTVISVLAGVVVLSVVGPLIYRWVIVRFLVASPVAVTAAVAAMKPSPEGHLTLKRNGKALEARVEISVPKGADPVSDLLISKLSIEGKAVIAGKKSLGAMAAGSRRTLVFVAPDSLPGKTKASTELAIDYTYKFGGGSGSGGMSSGGETPILK